MYVLCSPVVFHLLRVKVSACVGMNFDEMLFEGVVREWTVIGFESLESLDDVSSGGAFEAEKNWFGGVGAYCEEEVVVVILGSEAAVQGWVVDDVHEDSVSSVRGLVQVVLASWGFADGGNYAEDTIRVLVWDDFDVVPDVFLVALEKGLDRFVAEAMVEQVEEDFGVLSWAVL